MTSTSQQSMEAADAGKKDRQSHIILMVED
jgi:hypothetical protein